MRAFGIICALLALLTTACGNGRTQTSLASTVTFGQLPEFRSFSNFPGEVSGLVMAFTGAAILEGNNICLTLEPSLLGTPLLNGLPLSLVIDRRLLPSSEIDVQRDPDTGQMTYCIAPYLEPGSHTLDVDLNTTDGLEVYQVQFNTERITGWRPLIMYPGKLNGLRPILRENNVYALVTDQLCIVTSQRVLPSNIAPDDLLRVTFNDESLEPERITMDAQADTIESCFIMEVAPGEYRVEIILTALDSIVTTLNPVTAQEWYTGTLRVEADS